MPEVRIGALVLKFLVDEGISGGKAVMFEMSVPEKARGPAPHYHGDGDELVYGLAGKLTMTVDGIAHEVTRGQAVFVPRGSVHHFQNAHAGDAVVLSTLTPGPVGKNFFEELRA